MWALYNIMLGTLHYFQLVKFCSEVHISRKCPRDGNEPLDRSMRSGWSDPSKSKRSLSACCGADHSTAATPFLCSMQACWLISIHLNSSHRVDSSLRSLEWTRSICMTNEWRQKWLWTCIKPGNFLQWDFRAVLTHKSSIHITCALGSGGWNRDAPTSGAETCPKAPNNKVRFIWSEHLGYCSRQRHWRFSLLVFRINWDEFWRN